MSNSKQASWETLTHDEKNAQMIKQEIDLLSTFLERNAISREDYEKAMCVLKRKSRIY